MTHKHLFENSKRKGEKKSCVMSYYVALGSQSRWLRPRRVSHFNPSQMSELSAEAVAAFAKFDKTLPRSCWWDNGVLKMVDQRELPAKFVVCDFTNMLDVAKAIKDMLVRGAPAIGAAAGFGMVLAANAADVATVAELHSTLVGVKATLDASRPTAVNLMWATARLLDLSAELSNHAGMTVQAARAKLLEEAIQLCEDDVALNKRIGLFGASVVPDGANILHHCNTGTLATVQYGTAIGVIYSCHALGKNIHVWVDETRPRLQGAKLTAWELMEAGVPMHLIPDNAVGLLMYQKKVDVVMFGADRVTANGDVANKVGTMKVAVCAREFGVPVYAVVPTSTIDLTLESGHSIPIEERSATEVTHIEGISVAPLNVPVFNPGFDITPAKFLTGIITEEGICYPPFHMSLKKAKEAAEARIKANWQQRVAKLNA